MKNVPRGQDIAPQVIGFAQQIVDPKMVFARKVRRPLKQALELLATRPPDLVILDVEMPVLTLHEAHIA
jgi:CheY-like chemotaxis protein